MTGGTAKNATIGAARDGRCALVMEKHPNAFAAPDRGFLLLSADSCFAGEAFHVFFFGCGRRVVMTQEDKQRTSGFSGSHKLQKKQKMPLGQAIAVACGATFGTLFFCDRLLIKQKTTGVVGGAFVGYVVAAGAAHVLMGPFRGGGINMNSVVEMGVGLGGAFAVLFLLVFELHVFFGGCEPQRRTVVRNSVPQKKPPCLKKTGNA